MKLPGESRREIKKRTNHSSVCFKLERGLNGEGEDRGVDGVTLVIAALEGSFRLGFFFLTSSSSSYRYC